MKRVTIIGLVIALVAGFLIRVFLHWFTGLSEFTVLFFSLQLLSDWVVALLVLLIVVFFEKAPLSSVGFRELSGREFFWGFVGFLVGAVVFIVTGPLVHFFNWGTTSQGIAWLSVLPLWFRFLIVLTASVTQEVVFRGYVIERLSSLTGSVKLSGVISYFAFVLLHVPLWGLGGTVQIGVWSVVITVLYLRSRNLWRCIVMHFLNNAYAFLLLPLFL